MKIFQNLSRLWESCSTSPEIRHCFSEDTGGDKKQSRPSLSEHAFQEPKYAPTVCLGVLLIKKRQNPSIKGMQHNNRSCSPPSSGLKTSSVL